MEGLDFSHKKGGIGGMGGGVKKKGVSLILKQPFPIFLQVFVVFVFCLLTQFLSVLFLFHRKNFILLHLINRYKFYNI